MCGIVGVLAFGQMADKKEERARQFAMRFLGTELLKMTQERGKDATGVATLFDNGDYMGLKMGIPSEDFAARFGKTEKDFQGYMDIWRRKKAAARVFLGHCRKSSVGNSDDNKNNHPIKVGDIVGIHNGTLTNHEEIFKRLDCGRDGTVDSEAIFRLVHHYTNNGTAPFTLDMLEEVCKRLSGAFACLTFSGNNPFQVAAFRDGRPMEFCIIRPLKLVLIASESRFIKRTLYRYNQMAALYVESGHALPVVRKVDATLNTTTDLFSYVFDLRKDIGEATEVGDLFEKRKLSLTDKLWKPGSKATTTAGYNKTLGGAANTTGANAAAGTKKRTEVAASSPASGTATSTETKGSTQDQTNRQAGGLAWNRQSRSYGTVSDDEEAACRSHGTVGINNNTGEVINLDSGTVIAEGEKNPQEGSVSSSDANPLKKVTGPVDTLIDSPAKITEMEVKTTESPIIATSSQKKSSTGSAMLDHIRDNVSVEEVDFTTHPDVLELAEDAARDEANFSNDGEVQEALEIKNADALKNLPLYSLANRIKRFFFRKGFYLGYLACLEAGNKDGKDLQRNMLTRATRKVKSAQETIRQSKMLMSLMDRVLGDDKLDVSTVRSVLENTIAGGENISSEDIKRVCKPGDLKKNKVLSMIASALDSIEGR
jgi:glucosamine 6-phosphate synthetase-like amidotransferase/phosphosugar isomerase protein